MRLPRSGLHGTNMNPVHPPDQIDMSSSIFTSFCISNMLANTWLQDYDSRLSQTGRFRSTTDGPPIYQLFIHRPLSLTTATLTLPRPPPRSSTPPSFFSTTLHLRIRINPLAPASWPNLAQSGLQFEILSRGIFLAPPATETHQRHTRGEPRRISRFPPHPGRSRRCRQPGSQAMNDHTGIRSTEANKTMLRSERAAWRGRGVAWRNQDALFSTKLLPI